MKFWFKIDLGNTIETNKVIKTELKKSNCEHIFNTYLLTVSTCFTSVVTTQLHLRMHRIDLQESITSTKNIIQLLIKSYILTISNTKIKIVDGSTTCKKKNKQIM